jgi:chitinase
MPRLGSRTKRTLTAALLPLASTAAVIGGGTAAHAAANPGPGFPAHYAAPYVETWNSPSAMAAAESATGDKYFTLAFVISGGGCTATFNGNTSIADAGWTNAINNLRSSGGDVIASFGGASGTELGQACGDVASLEAQYRYVIDTLNLTRVDLDIEGAPVADSASIDRRNQALADLQQQYAASGKTLSVDYTLAVDPSGLPQDQLNLLNNAKSHNLNVNLVNIMTMDYGGSMDMGQAAISAANALHSQLGQIWTSKSSAQLWAMEGNTPMIGINDSTNEVFSTGNASSLESFAASNGIQELTFWALGRDQACSSPWTQPYAPSNCSGTSQSPYQFTGIFTAITGGTPPPPPPGGPTGQITGYGGKCVDVAGANPANGTAVQLYDCNGTSAQKWTVASDGSLRALGKCMDVTAAGTANGTQVQLYDCNGSGAQKWQHQSNGELINTNSGRCLDATGPSSANGTRLQIWDCYDSANQQWNLPS